MKKNTIFLLVLSLLLTLSLFFSGCSASWSNDKTSGMPQFGEEYPGSAVPEEDMDISPIDPIDPDLPGPADPDLPRKLIQNADMTLISKDPLRTKSDIESKAKSLGGLVSDFAQENNNYIYVQMTVEVPSDKLDIFLRQINDSGVKVESQSVTSEDVTDTYYDTETRLKTTQDLLDHYSGLLKQARNVEETLQVQARIDQLTLELESLQGRIKRLDALTLNSKIYIEIFQEKDPLLEKPSELEPLSWEHIKYFITSGFSRLGTVLLLLVQYVFIGLIIGSPLILVVVFIILIIHFVKKRKKKKELAAVSGQNNTVSDDVVKNE